MRFDCSLGCLSAEKISWLFDKILSQRLSYKFPIPVTRRQKHVLYYFSTIHPFFFASTQTQKASVSQSPCPHKQTTLSFEATYSISTEWHGGTSKKTDCGAGIYLISPGIWHLWVLFFSPHPPHPVCIQLIQLSASLHHPLDSCQKKFEVSQSEVLKIWGKSRPVKGPGTDQFCALRGTAGEMCISTCTWLHIASGRHLCLPPPPCITLPAHCQITTKSGGTAFRCFTGTRCLMIHNQVRQQKWWMGTVNGTGSIMTGSKNSKLKVSLFDVRRPEVNSKIWLQITDSSTISPCKRWRVE